MFVVAILQVSAFSSISIGGAGAGRPARHARLDRPAARRRSPAPSPASSAGLIVDVATLGTLGVTSLLLTLAGYWAGRYGETTGRGRAHAPLVATVAATVFVEVGGYVLALACSATPSTAQSVLVAAAGGA